MICPGFETPAYLFFAQDVPALLYYSHLPAAFMALLVGFFVFTQDTSSRASQLLLGIAGSFVAWIALNLIAWTNNSSDLIFFTWSFFGVLFTTIALLSFYLAYVFVRQEDLPSWAKWLLLGLGLPVLALAPSALNLSQFDLTGCSVYAEGFAYTTYYYGLGLASFIAIFALAAYQAGQLAGRDRRKVALFTFGIEAFLLMFFMSSYVASYLYEHGIVSDYSLEQYGLFGMAIFMAFLAYLIVQYRAFNAKLLATSALVWALCILIASQFLFVKEPTNFVLVGITLALAIIFGNVLVRSVRREVEQREKLQVLTEQLQKANTQLQDLSRFKTQLLSLASHQIKAPLAAIKGYISLMLEGGYGAVPENLQKPLNAMQHSANGLVDLVTSLLDLRKIDEGKMEYAFERTDVAEMVRDVVEELGMLAREKKLALTLSGADAPIFVRADRTKLRQVAQNLVDNAIKYTPSGSVSVAVTREGRFVTCTVSDSGLGMAPGLLPRLFDEFTRDQRVQHTIRGTGLGLYIAKRIIEAHGGDIRADSTGEGQGSRFWFTLPTAP
jgi:signal transduction histidine kinase